MIPILTTSHGTLAAGFVTGLRSYVRVGQYFPTLYNLCECAASLARTPSSMETCILCYPLEHVKQRSKEITEFTNNKLMPFGQLR